MLVRTGSTRAHVQEWRGLLLPLLLAGSASATPATTLIRFAPGVANLEYAEAELAAVPPPNAVGLPALGPDRWFGSVAFAALPGSDGDGARTIRFVVRYDAGRAFAVRFDRSVDFADAPESTLTEYPVTPGARSCFVHPDRIPIPEAVARRDPLLIRVVLEPQRNGEPPSYRLQRVFAPIGTVVLDGTPRRAVLWDGTLDGRFTDAYGDGIFVDVDGDGRIEVDPFSVEFGPFAVPFTLGARRYRAVPIGSDGTVLRWTDLGPSAPRRPVVPGEPAPAVVLRTADGREIDRTGWPGHPVLLHFWASWCGTCAAQIPALRDLGTEFRSHGLRIVGVSQDTDRTAFDAFVAGYALPWPNAFEGRRFWENEAAVAFQVRGAGGMILIAPDGRVDGKYTDVATVRGRTAALIGTDPGRGSLSVVRLREREK